MPENRNAEGAKRRVNGTFKPGVSGNPGGRPKALQALQELAQSETDENIRILKKLRDADDTPAAVVVAAIKEILDRGYGRPMQPTEHSGEMTQRVISGEPLTPEQWAQKYAAKDEPDAV